MAFTNTWDETSPAGTDPAKNADDDIRKVRLDTRERLAVDHQFSSDDSGLKVVGGHTKATLPTLAADPTQESDACIVYTKDASGKPELFSIDEDGNVVQLTTGGAVVVTAHKDTHDPGGSDPLDLGTPVDTGTANADGSAATFPRSDHVHKLHDHLHAGVAGDGGQFAGANSLTDLGIADDNIVQIDDADAADDDYAKFTANGLEGRSYAELRSDINVADGADVTADNPPQAHKDSHDPEDGSDALDTAIAVDTSTANAIGTSHSLSRADHVHKLHDHDHTGDAGDGGQLNTGALLDAAITAAKMGVPTHNILWADAERVDTYTADGSFYKPYKGAAGLNDAVTAASAGYVVVTLPGTYSQITPKAGVVVYAFGKVTISAVDKPLADLNITGAFELRNVNLTTTTIGNTIVDLKKGTIALKSCYVENGTITGDISTFAGNVVLTCEDTTFVTNNDAYWSIETTGTSAGYNLQVTIYRCTTAEPTKGFSFDHTNNSAARAWYTAMTRCTCNWGVYEFTGGKNHIFIDDTSFYTESASPLFTLTLDTDSEIVLTENRFYPAGTGKVVYLTANPKQLRVLGNEFRYTNSSQYDIEATVNITNAYVQGNSMYRGMERHIQDLQKVKRVGGGIDFYTDIHEALASVASNDTTIILMTDQNLSAAVTAPGYRVKIDGNHKALLGRAASTVMEILSSSADITLTNIDAEGNIGLNANGAKLRLEKGAYLNGQLAVNDGDSTTELIVDHARVIGNATSTRAIFIGHADPKIIVRNGSYLKGAAGSEAVLWNGSISNANFQMSHSKAYHGDGGANNPFARGGAQTPNWSICQSCVGALPAFGSNNIGTPWNVIDADGDF